MKILDSKIWEVGTWVYDLIIINLLWMIFSIPLITVGPATYAGLKCIKEIENGSCENVFTFYISSFKANFLAYTLGFNTFIGIIIVFVKLFFDIFDTGNLIITSLYVFIIVECILSMGGIFIVEEKDPINLIIKGIVCGNKNAMNVFFYTILCGCIVFIGMNVPILLIVTASLCMYIFNKVSVVNKT